MPPGGFDVRLAPAGAVSGEVVDPDGRGLAGARVVLMAGFGSALSLGAPVSQVSFTDAEGRFRIEGVAPGGYTIAADHGRYGFDPSWPDVTIAPGEEVVGVRVAMRACRSVAGVLLEGGRPVAGAWVMHEFTQEDGSFVVGCAPFESFEVDVRGFRVVDPMVPASADDIDDLVVRVQKRGSIAGRVTADGQAVAGAVVAVAAAVDPERADVVLDLGLGYAARTDGGGRYELALPEGTHEIVALDPESRRRSTPTRVDALAEVSLRDQDLELEQAGAIAGVLLDPDGAPVPHVEVHLAAPGEQLTRFSRPRAGSGKSDDQGQFWIGGLAPGRYRICLGWCYEGVSDPRYLPRDGDRFPEVEVPAGERAVTVHLEIRGRVGLSIRGRVKRDDGAPAEFAAVRTGRRDAQARADEEGRFVLSDLIEGNYDLEAIALDGMNGKIESIRAGAEGVAIEVPRAGAIRGAVAGGSGGCSIDIKPAEHLAGVASGRNAGSGIREFALDGVAPGDYRIDVRCDEGLGASTATVRPGETVTVAVPVGAGATIRGVARLFPGGEAAPNVTCRSGDAVARTDAAAFELSGVAPGRVQVHCESQRGASLLGGLGEANAAGDGVSAVEVFLVEASFETAGEPRDLLGARLRPVPSREPAALSFTQVDPAGAAASGGIEDGDILLSVAGASAVGSRHFAALIYLTSRPHGTVVALEVERGGARRAVTLTLGGAPVP